MASRDFTEREAEVYDRQIRLWGVEAQRRMRDSRVLIHGMTAVAAELSKNLVLSGISVSVHDNSVVTLPDIGANFFFTEADVGKTKAEACLPRLAELNPLVTVALEASTSSDTALQQYAVVCVSALDFGELSSINERCRRLGITCMGVCCAGLSGFVFLDLLRHEFIKTVSSPDAPAVQSTHTIEYAAFPELLACKWGNTKRVSSTLTALLSVGVARSRLERPREREDGSNAAAVEAAALQLLRDKGVDGSVDAVRASCQQWGCEVSPVAAILGGIMGQEVVKAISKRDEPICNFFVFNGDDCAGTIAALQL